MDLEVLSDLHKAYINLDALATNKRIPIQKWLEEQQFVLFVFHITSQEMDGSSVVSGVVSGLKVNLPPVFLAYTSRLQDGWLQYLPA